MRNVVILSGTLRTIKKTMRFFKENVLSSHNVDVFACIQNDTSQFEKEWTNRFREQLGSHLIHLEWFSLEKHYEWLVHRETQLQRMAIDQSCKEYLRQSGSMIEYFQLQLAYMTMHLYEQALGFKYDYLIRLRTDNLYAKPVDFHWLDRTEATIATRLETIRQRLCQTDPTVVLSAFMCTLLSNDVLPNLKQITCRFVPSETETILDNYQEATFPSKLYQYLHHGRYILTFRKNNVYLVRRDLFHLIPCLGTFYGFLRSPQSDAWYFNAEGQFWDACYFNAEGQFWDACYYSCLSVFNYDTEFDDSSLLIVTCGMDQSC